MKLPSYELKQKIEFIIYDADWKRLGLVKAFAIGEAKTLASHSFPSYRYITLSKES